MCVYACVRVCIYARVHVCVYACVRVCMCACMHICACACVRVCMCACMHICACTCVRVCMYARIHVYVCVCMCMHVYACVCMCMHVYACVCMYIFVVCYLHVCIYYGSLTEYIGYGVETINEWTRPISTGEWVWKSIIASRWEKWHTNILVFPIIICYFNKRFLVLRMYVCMGV